MANEKPDDKLPDLNYKVREIKHLRGLGNFDSEVDLMIERMNKIKPFREKELIIEAMGATRAECPFDCETWACNMGYWQIFQLDGHFSKIFLTHAQVRDVNGKPAFNWDEFNKLAKKGITVYNTHKVKGLNSKMYPYKRLSQKFNTDYFSNTISYMVALALDEGYKKISLYGCDMMTRSEYAWEKGGIEYWLGRGEGKGKNDPNYVEIKVCDGSTLLKTITGKPYGMKYFNLKDIDPTGELRKKVKAAVPPTTSTGFMYEDPIRPPDPQMTPYVSIVAETFGNAGRPANK